MAYLKVKYKKIMNEIDQKLKIPKGWENFVKNEAKKDNLIIKRKENVYVEIAKTNLSLTKR